MLIPYLYRKGADNKLATFYYFNTDNEQYSVRFYHLGEIQSKKKLMNCYSIAFMLSRPNGDTIVINKGLFYRVISTVITILKEFMAEKNPLKIYISPVENFRKDRRRFRIYKYYIKKLLPLDYKAKRKFLSHTFILEKC